MYILSLQDVFWSSYYPVLFGVQAAENGCINLSAKFLKKAMVIKTLLACSVKG